MPHATNLKPQKSPNPNYFIPSTSDNISQGTAQARHVVPDTPKSWCKISWAYKSKFGLGNRASLSQRKGNKTIPWPSVCIRSTGMKNERISCLDLGFILSYLITHMRSLKVCKWHQILNVSGTKHCGWEIFNMYSKAFLLKKERKEIRGFCWAWGWGLGAQICNPSYVGGWNRKIQSSRPTWVKWLWLSFKIKSMFLFVLFLG